MTFTISFDPLHFVGLMFLGLLAGYVGNVLASFVIAVITPKLDGQSIFTFLGLLQLSASMLPLKLFISGIVTGICMAHYATVAEATSAALWGTAAIGFVFSFLVGLGQRR
jgi:hypothetical protein